MSETKKKNIPMIIALSIPVVMIALIAVSIYVPALFVKPQFDFIYSSGGSYCAGHRYGVENGKVVRREITRKNEPSYCHGDRDPAIFYYDVERATSRQITFAEAQGYTLDNRFKSPDGFEVVSGHHSFDIFFLGGSSYNDRYLKKGTYTRRIKVRNGYYYDFKFLGWVGGMQFK